PSGFGHARSGIPKLERNLGTPRGEHRPSGEKANRWARKEALPQPRQTCDQAIVIVKIAAGLNRRITGAAFLEGLPADRGLMPIGETEIAALRMPLRRDVPPRTVNRSHVEIERWTRMRILVRLDEDPGFHRTGVNQIR